MPTNTDSLKPGQKISCTISSVPRAQDAKDTIARLMRRDLANKRALRKAYRVRQQRLNVYVRGNRDWVSRENPAKVVIVKSGSTWTMTYTPDIAPDIASVAKYLTIA
jgi:hypothetical protein